MAFWDKRRPEKKANNNDKYYNCHKLGHFRRDYFFPDRKLNWVTTSWKEELWRSDLHRGRSEIQSGILNCAYQAAKNNKAPKQNDDSNPEPFVPGPIGNAFMVRKQRLQNVGTNSTWFLDSCVSRHLCNDRALFSNLKAKSIDFVMAARQVIQIEEIGTVTILLEDGNIKLHNVVLALECDSNLISLN